MAFYKKWGSDGVVVIRSLHCVLLSCIVVQKSPVRWKFIRILLLGKYFLFLILPALPEVFTVLVYIFDKQMLVWNFQYCLLIFVCSSCLSQAIGYWGFLDPASILYTISGHLHWTVCCWSYNSLHVNSAMYAPETVQCLLVNITFEIFGIYSYLLDLWPDVLLYSSEMQICWTYKVL